MLKLSEREFSRKPGRALEAAQHGPVIIMDRDGPRFVLMSMADYRSLNANKNTLGSMLAMETPELIEPGFDFPKVG